MDWIDRIFRIASAFTVTVGLFGGLLYLRDAGRIRRRLKKLEEDMPRPAIVSRDSMGYVIVDPEQKVRYDVSVEPAIPGSDWMVIRGRNPNQVVDVLGNDPFQKKAKE